MCYSKAEGGQRCFSHAEARYAKAIAAVDANPNSAQAWEEFIQAEIEYCSTPQGEANLRAKVEQMKADDTDQEVINATEATIRRGLELRERNLAIRTAVRDATTPAVEATPEPAAHPTPEQAPAPESKDLAAQRASLGAGRTVGDPAMRDYIPPIWEDRDRGEDMPASRVQHGLRSTLDEALRRRALNPPADARETMLARFTQMAATGSAPANPAERAVFDAFKGVASRHVTNSEVTSAMLRGRAVQVLTQHAASSAAATDRPAGTQDVVDAVDACLDIRSAGVTARPANIETAARRVASILRTSPTLDRADQTRWAQDMVRDLTGHQVQIKRSPLPSRDPDQRWRVKVLS